MLTVTKQFKFDAAHYLPYYIGACHNLHGHTYHLDVTVTGDVISNTKHEKCGMIIDFKDLKLIVQEKVLKGYDHSCLNDFYINPTAETLAECIGTDISEALPEGVRLVRIRLWEGDESYVEYTPD